MKPCTRAISRLGHTHLISMRQICRGAYILCICKQEKHHDRRKLYIYRDVETDFNFFSSNKGDPESMLRLWLRHGEQVQDDPTTLKLCRADIFLPLFHSSFIVYPAFATKYQCYGWKAFIIHRFFSFIPTFTDHRLSSPCTIYQNTLYDSSLFTTYYSLSITRSTRCPSYPTSSDSTSVFPAWCRQRDCGRSDRAPCRS